MSWDIGREQWDNDPKLIREQEEYKNRGDSMLRDVYNAAVELLKYVRRSHPEDFKDEGTGYKCPHMRQLLHAVVKAGWEG